MPCTGWHDLHVAGFHVAGRPTYDSRAGRKCRHGEPHIRADESMLEVDSRKLEIEPIVSTVRTYRQMIHNNDQ